MGEALCRGTTEGADCESCPFSTGGGPTNPVVSEFPDDPAFIIIGEGPGWTEVKRDRPFVGASGQVLNGVLARIGRPREHVFVGNATLCMPPQGTPPEIREKAAKACNERLRRELALFPGKPILTLGAIAAHAVIPKPILDAIDPPDVPKTRKKQQKEKQKANRKAERKKNDAIDKIARRRFAQKVKVWRDQIKHEVHKLYHRKPDETYLTRELERVRPAIWKKAWNEAPREYQQKLEERALARKNKPKKPRKKKPIKITDIIGTLFDVDVDGSGVRPVIPAIHPAALLRGGGATIGGSHSPDMAYVNLIYDTAKINALAKGKDIRLSIDFAYEVDDAERANALFIEALNDALEEGAFSLDLETYVDDPDRHHALMQYEAKIRVIGIATNKKSISVLWDFLTPLSFSYLQLVLGKVAGRFHNGLYDRTVLRNKHYGFILPTVGIDDGAPVWSDSLLAHHAAFPGNSHRLQTVTAQFYGVGPWKSEFRNQEETPDKLAIYNAKDTGSTHAIAPIVEMWVKKTSTEIIYARDRRMSDIASRMHLRGQPVNREVNSALVQTFQRLARDARKRVEDKAADSKIQDRIRHFLAISLAAKARKKDLVRLEARREELPLGKKLDEFEALYELRYEDLKSVDWRWKINNSKHIAALIQAMDVPLTQTTDGGAISTKREILESLVQHGFVRDILEYRENEKMLDFTWPIFDRVIDGQLVQRGFADGDDRIHPIWSIHKIGPMGRLGADGHEQSTTREDS